MIGDFPTLFQFGGVEYRGSASGKAERRPLEIGGFEPQPEMTLAINVRKAQGDPVFGQDMPAENDTVTIAGRDYRIDRTEIDETGECLQMDLRSPHK